MVRGPKWQPEAPGYHARGRTRWSSSGPRTTRAFARRCGTSWPETLPEDWEEISRHGPGSDAQSTFSREFCGRLAERGWLTQSWPAEYGGADATPWRHAILSEEMWRCGEPRGSQYMNVNWIGPTIMKYGSEAQKHLHLDRISRGDVLWCQGFSEPEAGSDLVALRTLALRDGDDYVVNGTKIWTSYVAGRRVLLPARAHRPRVESPSSGISVLLAPMDAPGDPR